MSRRSRQRTSNGSGGTSFAKATRRQQKPRYGCYSTQTKKPHNLAHAKLILSDNVWAFTPNYDSPYGRADRYLPLEPERPPFKPWAAFRDHWRPEGISRTSRHVGLVPKTEVAASFDHLVGADHKGIRDCDPDCPRGLEVHGKPELCGLLHWKIARPLTA